MSSVGTSNFTTSKPLRVPMSDRSFILRCATVTLCLIVVAIVVAMIKGIFDPSIPNGPIYSIVGPAFQTVIGCLVGLLGGQLMNTPHPPPPPAPPAPTP